MTDDAYLAAEARGRVEIDRQLVSRGWVVQSWDELNLYAGQIVAVREFIRATGHGRADYLLFADCEAVGAVKANPSGTPFSGIEQNVPERRAANLNIKWLRDEYPDDASTLPAPSVLAAEIVEELEAALAQFLEPAASLPVDVSDENGQEMAS
jgi:hypothetical protein